MVTASQLTIGITPTLIATGPATVLVQESSKNNVANTVFLGDGSVTTSTGYSLAGNNVRIDLLKSDALFGIVAVPGNSLIEVLVIT